MTKSDPYEQRERRQLAVEEVYEASLKDPEMIHEAIVEGAARNDELLKHLLNGNSGVARVCYNYSYRGTLLSMAVEEYLWRNAEERVDNPEGFSGARISNIGTGNVV